MRVTLAFLDGDSIPVDVRSILPAAVLGLPKVEIGKLPLMVGNRSVKLGDLCTIKRRIRTGDELIFTGATARLINVGCGMDGGKLLVEGDVGGSAGAGMRSGELDILGSAGGCLGLGMQAGLIRVRGRAGDWCGAARPGRTHGMGGGTVLVGRDAGREAGAGMRRGLIYIAGDAGEYAGARMLAGTICIAGKAGMGAGLGMRRGSLVAGQVEGLLPGFLPAGPVDEEWLRIYFRYLGKLGVFGPAAWLETGLRRFTGDSLDLGRGELLVYDLVE